MGHDHREQGHFWGGGVWLPKVRMDLWAQAGGAPTWEGGRGEDRGAPRKRKKSQVGQAGRARATARAGGAARTRTGY